MTLDPVLLSRLQLVWVVAWHILLPAFTVGLASYIAVMEGMPSSPGGDLLRISSFWTRFLGLLRHGRGLGHRHAVPVRHQLEPLLRHHRQRPVADAGL